MISLLLSAKNDNHSQSQDELLSYLCFATDIVTANRENGYIQYTVYFGSRPEHESRSMADVSKGRITNIKKRGRLPYSIKYLCLCAFWKHDMNISSS